jgi:hypothetical protein
MSANKQTRANTRKPRSDFRRLGRRFMSGVLRSLFFVNKPARFKQAGFVLPTTVLLLLVLTLTVGALSFRTFSRSESVIAFRQEQLVDSAAAPAIDRAKAKLEYLFSKDPRFPGGIPSSDVIASMMLNDGVNVARNTSNDPYTFPDEARIDINNNSVNDNAWVFEADVNGDGNVEPEELITYSILMDDQATVGSTTISMTDNLSDAKADALISRNGPINTSEAQTGCRSDVAPESGWQAINAATLQKNFQITAFVADRNNAVNSTATALEFQQVRQADRGNKWGAWFKYDLELFPGASRDFYWNGAMHTEGNLLLRDKYVSRMISSHNSCLYTEPASEMTMADTGAYKGELLSAKVSANDFSGTSASDAANPTVHLFTRNAQKPSVSGNAVKIWTDEDSVDADAEDLRNILLDPIKLFTEDVLAHRSDTGWSHRTDDWDTKKRIYNNPSATPYLDDTYRADNRYGPKAVYDDNNAIPSGSSVGDTITGNNALTALDAASNVYGLDGYWERRAIGQGLRIIVGQRLELGDTFGWKGNSEPLYPPTSNISTEVRQRRALYDNLASVQGMVVYHRESSSGELPLACIASTAHPGTATTIQNSRTFTNYPTPSSITPKMQVDFLTGNGTNGWEFDFYSSFSSKIAATEPLGIALRNLAYFAGDPKGGAPSFVPEQLFPDLSPVVHPYPQQAMWGDFSNLRRVVSSLDSGTTYTNLSPADKSTLHTAACTLGLLAYSIDTQVSSGGPTLLTYLPQHSDALHLGSDILTSMGLTNNPSSTPAGCTVAPSGSRISVPDLGSNEPYDYDCRNLVVNKEAIINSLPAGSNDQKAARLLSNLGQIQRDRTFGFLPSDNSNFSNYIGKAGSTKYLFKIPSECNPNANSDIRNVFNSAYGAGGNSDGRLGLSVMCTPPGPKYPSLYYLFPERDHSQVGSGIYAQPATEEYINQPYLTDATTGVNRSVTYQVVGDSGTVSGVQDDTDAGAGAIKLLPRPLSTSWQLPKSTAPAGSFNPESMQISALGSLTEVSLLDKGMYDGREMLGLRMLDVDINKLITDTNSSDHWIADRDGIVYAFREDAIREDAIVRPKNSSTTWANCDTWSELYTNATSSDNKVTGNNRDCRLKKISSSPFLQDPPLMANTLISTKPIDFYADPDRRPHGFRLVNGSTLYRVKPDGQPTESGMTFVSDNMVYIKGDFNLHSSTGVLGTGATACSNLIEEFTDKLINNACADRTITATPMDFYDARAVNERNEANFAKPAIDRWRPVEVVGDAVGVLSGAFRDGNVQDGFTLLRTLNNSIGQGTSSYQNQNRLSANDTVAASAWKHVNPSDITTPILIDRNGGVIKADNTAAASTDFLLFSGSPDNTNDFNDKRGGDLEDATSTIVNAVFISGIVPSQAGQTYGGMHNFPRFLEQWVDTNLQIAGGFFQLNFSTSATAPFDQDAWEPGADPSVDQNNGVGRRTRFYGAPNRIWGYDVGLQYAPPGPIARRFVTVGRPRSEFYRELPVNDPYVTNLRCATFNGSRIDSRATCTP